LPIGFDAIFSTAVRSLTVRFENENFNPQNKAAIRLRALYRFVRIRETSLAVEWLTFSPAGQII
jgi:hypothetical protein